MATQSSSSNPPNPSTVDNPSSNPASQPLQETTTNEGQTTTDPPKEISPKSVFVNSQPIREEQVQNAVKFLSHPRVKGSPVVHRRNFLERKGLTKEEIDEAFRRVPDQAPTGATSQTGTYPDTNATAPSSIQTHAPVQAMQPMSSASPGALSTVRRKFHWSHAVYAVGFFAISGAGTALLFKKTIIPRFKSWVRRVVLEEEVVIEQKIVVEDAAKAAKAAAAAAADLAKVAERMLNSKDEEKERFMDFMNNLLDTQIQEIKSMRTSITRLEGQLYSAGRNPIREEYIDGSAARSMQTLDNRSGFDARSVRSASPPPSTEPPHPKSYMEIMAMVQRGERPPNVRDIDDRPPNPNQPISNPSLAPRAKPWEVTQTTYISNSISQRQAPSEGGTSYTSQDNGVTHHLNNEGSPPWWQQKNVRITEVDNSSVSNGTINIDHPPQRRWVPPQPPPVSMPEAAVAIRHPKSAPKDVNEVDELQRVTMISEFGGQLATSGGSGSSEKISSEIQEEEQVS